MGTSQFRTIESRTEQVRASQICAVEIRVSEARDSFVCVTASIPFQNSFLSPFEQFDCFVAIHVGGPYNEFYNAWNPRAQSTREDSTHLPPWRMQQMPRKWLPLSLSLLCFAAIPSATYAWNSTGHRVIASIAYRQLDDPTKRRIADILLKSRNGDAARACYEL